MFKSLFACIAVACMVVSCSPNNVTIDNSLKKYFEEEKVIGSFSMFDNGQSNFTIYNLARYRDTAYLPASTFKIVNSLIGIQTGKVKDSAAIIPWDGVTRSVQAWNADLSMAQAFKVSSVPWFQELARRIGKDTMQKWIDTLGYGASAGKPVIGKIDTFWLDNSLKVTADEQLGLVKKLYFDQLPFFARTQQIVKGMMLQEDNTNYKLSYKSGLGITENKHSLAWLVGWIEENHHPYFFVLQVESADPNADLAAARVKVLTGILKQLGFMEGKK